MSKSLNVFIIGNILSCSLRVFNLIFCGFPLRFIPLYIGDNQKYKDENEMRQEKENEKKAKSKTAKVAIVRNIHTRITV